MRQSFLRKGTAAVAAMLMGANVMAQSFDLTKEFEGDIEDMLEEGVISASLTNDGAPRLLLIEDSEGNGENYDSDGNYCYTHRMDKISILDKNLDTDKEFTSGPLFEELVNVTAKSAAKTLKIVSVDTVYSGNEALDRFYSGFSVRIYDEETNSNNRYYYSDLVANFTEEEVRGYVNDWLEGRSYKDTTYLGERFLFESYYVQESDYYDWGIQYPTEGWIYKDHDDLCKVRIKYTADEFEEISRWNSRIRSAFYNADIYYLPIGTENYCQAIISQGLFNDDDKYEFLLPVTAVLENSSYDSWNGTLTTEYEHEPIGYKVVSEDGSTLHELIVNAEKDNDVRCYAYVISLGDKNYLMVNTYKRVNRENGGSGYDYTDEVTRFYEIKKSGSGTSIQKVREMRGSMNIRPTVANRDEQITITLDDDNNSSARELIITSTNGQLVERRTIPAGENTVQMNAAMMRSGMYNFTLQKKGEVVDNGKVIVK